MSAVNSPVYIADNKLHTQKDGKYTSIPCGAIENYIKNLDSIKRRKEWKTSGVGAEFMGVERYDDRQARENIAVTDVIMLDPEQCIYVARLDEGTAIYKKSLTDVDETEAVVLRKENIIVHDIDYDASHQRLVMSSGTAYDYERHLSILYLDKSSVRYITEGECLDANPIFDKKSANVIYYDSCGYGFDQQGRIITGPREICRLDLSSGDLQTVLGDTEHDYLKPQVDKHGNIYCLRRPYKDSPDSSFSGLKNALLAPGKIFKAIFGWLDFFTQRYSGESLKSSSGQNPAKTKQKSAEEIFIEGNLIKAQNNLEKNKQTGEKFPGVIPKRWELIKVTPAGEVSVLKQGVLSFSITNEQIFYSNGKFLLALKNDEPHSSETMIVEEKLINKIRSFTSC